MLKFVLKTEIYQQKCSKTTVWTVKKVNFKMDEELTTLRVQYLIDTDPFSSLSIYPVPSRAPVYSFKISTPLATQLGALLRCIAAPQRVRRNFTKTFLGLTVLLFTRIKWDWVLLCNFWLLLSDSYNFYSSFFFVLWTLSIKFLVTVSTIKTIMNKEKR